MHSKARTAMFDAGMHIIRDHQAVRAYSARSKLKHSALALWTRTQLNPTQNALGDAAALLQAVLDVHPVMDSTVQARDCGFVGGSAK